MRSTSLKLCAGLIFLGLSSAFFYYNEVSRLVGNSPYQTSDRDASHRIGVFIADLNPSVVKNLGDFRIHGIWKEHSYRHVRTGLFSSKIESNQDSSIRFIFSTSEIMKAWMVGESMLVIDGQETAPTLVSDGRVALNGFSAELEIHSVSLRSRGRIIDEIRFHSN